MSGAFFSTDAAPAAPLVARRSTATRVESVDGAALAALVPAWEALAAEAGEPNPFYEHWMLLPALEAFAAGQDLRFIAVWIGGELCALFPFERVARYKGLPATTLKSYRHRHCMLCTPLVRAGRAAQCLEALHGWLRTNGESAALLQFECLVADGPFHRALGAWLEATRQPALVTDSYRRALLRKEGDAEHYLAGALTRHVRQDLRRREKRLGESGKVTHPVLRPGDDLERWLDDLLQLEAGGWKGEAGSALQCKAADRRFATEIFGEAFRRGRLLMGGLDLHDGIQALRRGAAEHRGRHH